MNLPAFRYHPDPIATGSVERSDATCRCCGQARGFGYVGPVYSEEDDLDGQICPWCIADGSAAEKFDAVFVDAEGVGGGDEDWAEVDDAIIDVVTTRTPGFSAWQQERWFTCCDDAGAFLGAAGAKELKQFGQAAIDAVLANTDRELDDLDKSDGPTAYVFKCLHCGAFGGYVDFT